MNGSQKFQEKVALVTGGTSGVGLRVAEGLARGGATVIVNGRSVERGERAVASLKSVTDSVRFLAADCARYKSIAEVIDAIVSDHGALDILVSAGGEGVVRPKPFAQMSPAEIEQGLTDRFLPRIFPVHAAIPHMRESGGSVVLLTTDAGRYPTPGEAIIGASGAGTILLTKALGKELSRRKIRVNCIAMTLTADTVSWDKIFANPSFESNLFSKALEKFPYGRAPNAQEVADVALFLASDAAVQVTGQTVSVNGGLSFGGW
jgi:2-hydroxycyclohexanecarboxyl-CoA dehydrogenase